MSLTLKIGAAGGRRAGGDHGAVVFFVKRLCVVVCFAGRELPLVFLRRCDTPLVTHMDLKKIYIRDA